MPCFALFELVLLVLPYVLRWILVSLFEKAFRNTRLYSS